MPLPPPRNSAAVDRREKSTRRKARLEAEASRQKGPIVKQCDVTIGSIFPVPVCSNEGVTAGNSSEQPDGLV